MKSYIFRFLLLLLPFIGCQPKQPEELTPPAAKTSLIQGATGLRLDSILTPYILELRQRTDNTAGLAIGITKGEEIIYARTFGYANKENDQRANFNTLFHIASVSKPFTAVAIMKLVEQGTISLDDRLIDHIPEFRMKGNDYDKITIKHILTHTSGIPRHVSVDDWLQPSFGPKALDENLAAVQDFELDFEPGTEYNYSNAAFDILGIVIQRVSNVRFTDFVKQQVLQPAGMINSTYIKPVDSLPNNWAEAHSYGLETQPWEPYPYSEKTSPSSGLQTTLLDMCQWGLINLGKGGYKKHTILTKESFDTIFTPYYKTPWGDSIGLSWFLQSYLERPNIMHLGNDTGFEASMYIYPKDDISIVVMANRDFSRTGRMGLAATEILFETTPKTYNISAKYEFVKTYKAFGIEKAISKWQALKKDTTDIYFVSDDHILTTGAILENGKKWKETKEVLNYYLTLNDQSTYAWRLLGNAYANLNDTVTALSSYRRALDINSEYQKATVAIEKLLGTEPLEK